MRQESSVRIDRTPRPHRVKAEIHQVCGFQCQATDEEQEKEMWPCHVRMLADDALLWLIVLMAATLACFPRTSTLSRVKTERIHQPPDESIDPG